MQQHFAKQIADIRLDNDKALSEVSKLYEIEFGEKQTNDEENQYYEIRGKKIDIRASLNNKIKYNE